MNNAAKTIPAEYSRKIAVASDLADRAWLRGGLDALQEELASLRRLEADDLIASEVERLYHAQCMRALPEQRLRAQA
jgi:hypothetical protein